MLQFNSEPVRPQGHQPGASLNLHRRYMRHLYRQSKLRTRLGRLRPVLVGALLSILNVLSVASSAAAAEQAKPLALDAEARPATAKPLAQSDAQQYCSNIAGAAIDARYAWQTKKMADLEDHLKTRIAELEAKEQEYKSWVERRQALAKQAEDSLVGIYAHMRPETAAAQLQVLDDDMAAAVLGQLNARIASAILNEFQPEHAARLANVMAGRPVSPPDGKKL